MLSIQSLRVTYGPRTVLYDISLEVQRGEVMALIGPNGAGKTSLVRAVSGTAAIASGQITVDGQNISHMKAVERARLLSVVPQARQLGGAYTVWQAVMMGRTPHMSWLGHESLSDRDAVQRALEQTNLTDFADRTIANLSGGEQQRVLLARALAQDTPVMLLDEPTNHLDLQHQTNLLTLVRKLTVEKRLAVMMAMHDLNLVSSVADRVALILAGRLQAIGTPQEVIRAETISAVYQTPVEIIAHPVNGAPLIFPKGMIASEVDPAESSSNHP